MNCEAPNHERQCNRIGSTRDHFTPQSLAKVMGIKAKEYNGTANIQYLSPACHQAKDLITRTEIVCNRTRGGAKTIWEHHNELIIYQKRLFRQINQGNYSK